MLSYNSQLSERGVTNTAEIILHLFKIPVYQFRAVASLLLTNKHKIFYKYNIDILISTYNFSYMRRSVEKYK